MRIVIAPDSFKESLAAQEVCAAIARGVRHVCPEADIAMIPMADGGEGTVDALIAATGGDHLQTRVTGPRGESVLASWGMLGGSSRTAVIEMAAASGLALVPMTCRDPLVTSTLGTGELIRSAIEAGASRIIIGIGGSATNDGGAGAAQAVGVRFFDRSDRLLEPGLAGGQLAEIARIDLADRDPRVAGTAILAACDVDNPLCGERGAAVIYAPQKGASPQQVAILDRQLAHLAGLIERDLGIRVRDLPGAGAAGGLGAGLVAFFGAKLQAGVQLVMDALHVADRIAGADLVITGEGRIDRQSMMGKVVAGVGRAAQAARVPAIALVGSVGEGADTTLAVLDSFHPINPPGTPLAQALARTSSSLETTAAAVLRNRLTGST